MWHNLNAHFQSRQVETLDFQVILETRDSQSVGKKLSSLSDIKENQLPSKDQTSISRSKEIKVTRFPSHLPRLYHKAPVKLSIKKEPNKKQTMGPKKAIIFHGLQILLEGFKSLTSWKESTRQAEVAKGFGYPNTCWTLNLIVGFQKGCLRFAKSTVGLSPQTAIMGLNT